MSIKVGDKVKFVNERELGENFIKYRNHEPTEGDYLTQRKFQGQVVEVKEINVDSMDKTIVFKSDKCPHVELLIERFKKASCFKIPDKMFTL